MNPDAIFGGLSALVMLAVVVHLVARMFRDGSLSRYDRGTLLVAFAWQLNGLVWFLFPEAGMETWTGVYAITGSLMVAGFALWYWGYRERQEEVASRRKCRS